MSKYNVHAGHCKSGKTACGAVSILDESIENRLIKKSVIKTLKADGHTVYDCTNDKASSVNDNLSKIVAKCNKHAVTLDVSLHLNMARNDKKGDGKIGGAEAWVTANEGIKKEAATQILKNLENLGFTNRGTKETNNLYVLNRTNSKAVLVECLFCDDRDDYNLYNQVGSDAVGFAIAKGMQKKSNIQKYKALYGMNIRENPDVESKHVSSIHKDAILSGVVVKNNWLKTAKGYVRIKGMKTYLKQV